MKKITLLLGVLAIMKLLSTTIEPEGDNMNIIYQKEGIVKQMASIDKNHIQIMIEEAISPFYLEILEENINSLREEEFLHIKYEEPNRIKVGNMVERNISEVYLIIDSHQFTPNSIILVLEDGKYESWMLNHKVIDLLD